MSCLKASIENLNTENIMVKGKFHDKRLTKSWLLSKGTLLQILLLLLELLIVNGGLLVLLVLGHKVVHVGLGLGKLHLVHTLTSAPMEESLGNNK